MTDQMPIQKNSNTGPEDIFGGVDSTATTPSPIAPLAPSLGGRVPLILPTAKMQQPKTWIPILILVILALFLIGGGAVAFWWYFNQDDSSKVVTPVNVNNNTVKNANTDLIPLNANSTLQVVNQNVVLTNANSTLSQVINENVNIAVSPVVNANATIPVTNTATININSSAVPPTNTSTAPSNSNLSATTNANIPPAVQSQLDTLANQDDDKDGLTNLQEKALSTNSNLADTDGDGLSDSAEVNIYKSNPLLKDTDGDSYPDCTEVKNGYSPIGAGKLAVGLSTNVICPVQ